MIAKRLVVFFTLFLAFAVMAVTGSSCQPSPLPGTQIASGGQPTLEWFGWSHFRITTGDGTVLLINPFITGNLDASITVDELTRVDYILPVDGHGDELGNTIAIAQKTGARVIPGGFELGSYLIQKGIPAAQVIRSNPGNVHYLGSITVRVVNSVHGSGLPQPTIENPYGGPAAGYIITLENGYTVYFAGSTAATMDMQLWGSAFKPDLAILPLNSNRDPIDVAQMVKLLSTENPNLKRVIPHHQRVEPPAGATTIDQMENAIRDFAKSSVTVMRLQRGQVVPLTR